MSESKEETLPQSSSSAIKLFGKTISILSSSLVNQQRQRESRVFADDDDHHHQYHSYASKDVKTPLEEEEDKEYSEAEVIVNSINLRTSPNIGEEPKTPSTEREASSLKFSKNGEGEQIDQTSSGSSQEKPLKKPDKILPCPRCNSMDTKFCYYNNYNVSQPRHFCRNCQRYWTAGGNMRNVPVGAGRRKSKNSAYASSNYRQIMVPFIGNNTRHITFGSDPHHPETVPFSISRNDWSSGLSVAEQRRDCNSASGLARPCNSPTPPPVLSPSGFPVQLPTETAYSSYALSGQYLSTMNVSPKLLGKHSREGYIICPSNLAGSNNDNGRSAERGIFHGFQLMKGPDDRNPYVADTSATVLQANPAAFSRSLNFRENA